MRSSLIFDKAHYEARNAALTEVVRRVLPDLIPRLNLKTVLDLGCGVGYYAELLHGLGLEVVAVDGRAENVAEAQKRYPHLNFEVADAQDPNLSRLGVFDLVFCFGLLYHLENPFRAIRSIAGLTSKLTFVEGMVYPSPEPTMVLMDENDYVDQGLNFLAFYPSESCLVKMLRRSGFSNCYMPQRMPDHPDYLPGADGFRLRSIFVGSIAPIDTPALKLWPEPSREFAPWSMMPLYPARRMRKVYGAMDRLFRGKQR